MIWGAHPYFWKHPYQRIPTTIHRENAFLEGESKSSKCDTCWMVQKSGKHEFYTSQISRIATQVLYHQEFQVPRMEVLNLLRLFWGWVFPYIRLIYSLYS